MKTSTDRSRRWPGERHGHGPRHHEERLEMARHGRGRHGRFGFGDDPRFPFRDGGLGSFGRGPWFGHGPKVGRGDVRTAVLRLLAEEPRNGYQIIQELEQRSRGVWRPSSGSIYPALQQLEDEGLVQAEEREGKRVFRLTEAGQEAVEAMGSDAAAPWETAAGIDDETGALAMELRMLIGQVAGALNQVAQAGNAAQIDKAKVVMVNTRRSLYRILAEDDTDGVTHL